MRSIGNRLRPAAPANQCLTLRVRHCLIGFGLNHAFLNIGHVTVTKPAELARNRKSSA